MPTTSPASAPTRLHRSDLVTAIVFMLLGAAAITATLDIPTDAGGLFDLQSPLFFPFLLGWLILLIAARLGVRALRGTAGQAELADETPPRLGRMGLAALVMVLYTAAIFTVGYWPASSVTIVVMTWLLAPQPLVRREWMWLLVVAAVTPGVISAAFNTFLSVQMPNGGGW